MNLLRKCIAEFIGAFAIVLAGCGAIAVDGLSHHAIGHVGISIVWGLVVACLIYAVGHVSGAHFNPAVTLAFAAARHFPKPEIVPYILAQLAGAAAASAVQRLTLTPVLEHLTAAGQTGLALNLGVTQPIDGAFWTAAVWEFLLTFLLMFVIMGVATDYRAVSPAAGVAIGGTVLFEAMFAGPLCNASMNPARSFGPALVTGQWTDFGAYLLGPVAGALVAAWLYEFLRCPPAPDKGGVKGCC